MYKKILVAYDGSEDSEVALRRGSDLARLCNARLHLVGIVASPTYATGPFDGGYVLADMWTAERKDMDVALNAASQKLSGDGLSIDKSVREGSPAYEIAACAEQIEADLVIIGHSNKGILARWFEGSVGQGLLRELPCNLLVATD